MGKTFLTCRPNPPPAQPAAGPMSLPFVNPVELLELGATPIGELDGAKLRKESQRMRLKLQLEEDGTITHHGQKLDLSAVQVACAELDDPKRLRVWHRLASMAALSGFLGKGRVEPWIHSATGYVVSAADRELIEVVGARYAEQFDRALTVAFNADDHNRLEQLCELPILFRPSDGSQAYKGVSRILREQIKKIRDLAEALDEGDEEDEANEALDDILADNFHAVNLGHLPDAHFAGLRTDFVLAVRQYAVGLFNTFYEVATPLRLLESAAAYRTDSQTDDKIADDLKQIREIEERQSEQKRQAAFMEQYGHLFAKLREFIEQVEQKKPVATKITTWTKSLNPAIAALNESTETGEIELRQSFAVGLRNLSVALWNKLDDGQTALLVLKRALTIKAGADTLAELRRAMKDLTEAIEKHEDRQRVNKALEQAVSWIEQTKRKVPGLQVRTWAKELSDTIEWLNDKGDVMKEARQALALALRGLAVDCWNNMDDGETATVVLAQAFRLHLDYATKANLQKVSSDLTEAMRPRGLFGWLKKLLNCIMPLLLVGGLASCEPAQSSYKSQRVEQNTPVLADSATYEPQVSPYAGNQLANGASPLDNCFGRGKYAGPCWVKFDNSANSTDAIMCLVNTRTGRVIRNEYIRAGTVFKMTRVPKGHYYIKGFYGNDWNPTRRSACGTRGYFDSNQNFSASPDDAFKVVNDARGFSTNTITLYGVANGNMAQEPLSAEQFFQQ